MTISLRLSENDSMLIKKYAELHNMSVSDLLRQSVLEKIEDEYDLRVYREAMEEYRESGKTYTLAEVEKELHLQ